MRVFLFFCSLCKCWGRGVKVNVSVSHVDFFPSSVCRTCSYFLCPHACERLLFSGEIPWTIFLMQFHTHHSLDFIRKLKMFKTTGYIHLYYKIPFLSGVAYIHLYLWLFLFFLIIHREFCFNIFSVWYKAATHVSWEVLWTKGTSPRPS